MNEKPVIIHREAGGFETNNKVHELEAVNILVDVRRIKQNLNCSTEDTFDDDFKVILIIKTTKTIFKYLKRTY